MDKITTLEFDTAVSYFAGLFGWAVTPISERVATVGAFLITTQDGYYMVHGVKVIGMGVTIRAAVEDLIKLTFKAQEREIVDLRL